jgi:hypothetical protein
MLCLRKCIGVCARIEENAMSIPIQSRFAFGKRFGLAPDAIFRLWKSALKDDESLIDEANAATYDRMISIDPVRAEQVMSLIIRRHADQVATVWLPRANLSPRYAVSAAGRDFPLVQSLDPPRFPLCGAFARLAAPSPRRFPLRVLEKTGYNRAEWIGVKLMVLTFGDLELLKQLRAAGGLGRNVRELNILITLDRLVKGGYLLGRAIGRDSVQYRITKRGQDAIVEHDL